MKKIILLSFVAILSIISSFHSYAQEKAKDTVFSSNWTILGPCKIIKVQTPHNVIYQINGEEFSIKANAIIRDGEFIDFKTIGKLPIEQRNLKAIDSLINLNFKDKNYFHYMYEYHQAKKMKVTGIIFTYLGMGTVAIASLQLKAAYSNSTASRNATMVLLGGLVVMDIGIPLWIGGRIKAKNNVKALEKCKNSNTSLNMGISENGIGLVFTF